MRSVRSDGDRLFADPGRRTLAIPLLLAVVGPAPAWIDHFGLHTIRFVIEPSTEIAVLQVEQVSREGNNLPFSKVADLKGKAPEGDIRYEVSGGFRAREPRRIMS